MLQKMMLRVTQVANCREQPGQTGSFSRPLSHWLSKERRLKFSLAFLSMPCNAQSFVSMLWVAGPVLPYRNAPHW